MPRSAFSEWTEKARTLLRPVFSRLSSAVSALSARIRSATGRLGARLRSLSAKWPKRSRTGIWDINPETLPVWKRIPVKLARILWLTVRDFLRNDCPLHASRLTYLTVLSIVPVIALILFFMKTVMVEDELRFRTKKAVHEILTSDLGLSFLATEENQFPELDAGSFEEAQLILRLEEERERIEAEKGVVEAVAESAPEASLPAGTPAPAEAATPAVAGAAPAEPMAFNEERIMHLIDKGFDTIADLNFNALGGLGLFCLLWAAISVIADVEKTFNRLWGVSENRPLLRKFTDYLSFLILIPFLAAASASIPIMATVNEHLHRLTDSAVLQPLLQTGLFRTVWVIFLLTVAFTFLLRATPNTHVKFVPGLVGGLAAAIVIMLWLKLCIVLQIGVARQSALFGSFATVPVLLIWVYISWQILLGAAELSFSVQNASTHPGPATPKPPSMNARVRLAADLLHTLAEDLTPGRSGLLNVDAYARTHICSARFLRDVVAQLERVNLIAPVADRPSCYTARIDLHTFTFNDLLRALMADGAAPAELGVQQLPVPRGAAVFAAPPPTAHND